jgi:hypothetical protein
MDPRIADYIRQHRDRYTRDAIRQRLAEAGYEPPDIDATWAAIEAETRDSGTIGSPRFWRYFWVWVAATYLLAFVVVVMATGLLTSGMTPAAAVYAVALGIALLAAWGIVAATRPAQRSHGTALAIGGVIPLVFALLVGGSCYGLIGTPPPPPRSGLMQLHLAPPHAFDGSGTATCQAATGGETGFSVRTENLGTLGGRQVSASIDAFAGVPKAPDAPLPSGPFDQVFLYITLLPTSGNELEAAYNNVAGSGLELDISAGGLVGTVTFRELSSMPVGAPGEQPGQDSVSGSISWHCD